MSSRDEILTILLAQSGDLDALDQLFRSVQEPLYLRVFSIVGHRELAEDVVQDVFVLMQRKLGWLRDPAHFRAWTFRIAAREAVRAVGKEKQRFGRGPEEPLVELVEPRQREPAEAVAASEVLEFVHELPTGCRAVLTLHYLDDLPLTEVAQVLDLPVGTVKSRLSYGLGVLRRRLTAD